GYLAGNVHQEIDVRRSKRILFAAGQRDDSEGAAAAGKGNKSVGFEPFTLNHGQDGRHVVNVVDLVQNDRLNIGEGLTAHRTVHGNDKVLAEKPPAVRKIESFNAQKGLVQGRQHDRNTGARNSPPDSRCHSLEQFLEIQV